MDSSQLGDAGRGLYAKTEFSVGDTIAVFWGLVRASTDDDHDSLVALCDEVGMPSKDLIREGFHVATLAFGITYMIGFFQW